MLVVAALAAAWKESQDAVVAALQISHTHAILMSLDRLRGDALRIELSTQNYGFQATQRRLAERNAAISAREITLRQIKGLTADNPRQQERWTRLCAVIDERIAISRRTELLRKTQASKRPRIEDAAPDGRGRIPGWPRRPAHAER